MVIFPFTLCKPQNLIYCLLDLPLHLKVAIRNFLESDKLKLPPRLMLFPINIIAIVLNSLFNVAGCMV